MVGIVLMDGVMCGFVILMGKFCKFLLIGFCVELFEVKDGIVLFVDGMFMDLGWIVIIEVFN